MLDIHHHISELHRDGFTLISGVLSPSEIKTMKDDVIEIFETSNDGYGAILRTKMFERGVQFEQLMMRPGIVDFAETLLGERCHMISMNAIRTPRNTGIDSWHVDDDLFFSLPDGVELDNRIQLPVFMITCMYYLVDVEENMGPTQFIPGSHRSGRHPDRNADPPSFDGRNPVSILAKAGDCLIFNGQTWHRGSRNRSDKERIVQQVTYGRRWISQRLYPFINYRMPQHVLDRWSGHPRMKRLLGMHERGAYG